MVNKIAVIAIVAILAVPIMIGYGMNLEPTVVTEYLADNDQVNTTQLLQNGTVPNYLHADAYQINTSFSYPGVGTADLIPSYYGISSTVSSYCLRVFHYKNQSWNNVNQNIDYPYFYEQFDYDPANNSHSITVYGLVGGVETLLYTFNNIHSICYYKDTGDYTISYYTGTGYNVQYYSLNGQLTKLILNTISGKSDVYISSYRDGYYADIAAGFYFEGEPNKWRIDLPEGSKSAVLTINLDSITASTYRILFTSAFNNYTTLEKTTTGGVVSWKYIFNGTPTELYYNPNISNNTYQIYFDISKTSEDSTYKYFKLDTTFKYVGSWPTVIGKANYYKEYSFTQNTHLSLSSPDATLDHIDFISYNNSNNLGNSPIMRMDDVYLRGFDLPAIVNNTYDPASFKNNPLTTIKNINLYGSSIVFGGNTYTVDSTGNITLGTHEIPVDNLKLESTPTTGGYENKINGYVVSVTANPSTITFYGSWRATVVTDSQSVNTYNHTEWKVGQFAWDGIDQNFLIVGLITSLAAFLGLGIYARKSNSKGVIPLMIVCGGAAALFFVML